MSDNRRIPDAPKNTNEGPREIHPFKSTIRGEDTVIGEDTIVFSDFRPKIVTSEVNTRPLPESDPENESDVPADPKRPDKPAGKKVTTNKQAADAEKLKTQASPGNE